MKKKILAGLLALCMIFSMVPMSAFAEREGDASPADGATQVVRAPLGDTAENGYAPEQLNLEGYKVEATEDTNSQVEGITKVYDVKVTHPALLKHKNAQTPNAVEGLWVGIGVPITTKGSANGDTPAGQAGNGSSYFAFVTAKTDFSTIVSDVIKKFDWASSNSAGYSEYGWRSNDGEHLFQWYDVSKETYKTNTPYLVERNPKSEGQGYTYIVYRLDFSGVKEGHLVTIEEPTNGTLTVKNGTTEVETGTPVAVGTELTITAEPEQGYEIKAVKVGDTALTANNGAYTTKINDADITISAEFEKTPGEVVKITGMKFFADEAKLPQTPAVERNTLRVEFTADTESMTEDLQYGIFIKYPAGTTFKANALEGIPQFTTADGAKYVGLIGGPASEWKDSDSNAYESNSLSLKPCSGTEGTDIFEGDIAAGTYTAVVATLSGSTWTIIDGSEKEITLDEVTVDLGTGHTPASCIEAQNNDEPFYEINASEPTKITFMANAALLPTEDSDNAGTDLAKLIRVKSDLKGPWEYDATSKTFTYVEPVTDGISVGFAWNGDDANTAINADIAAAGKTKTVTDSIDQTFWLLLNEDMTDAETKRYYEIKLGDTVLDEGAIVGASGKIGIVYGSFLMKKEDGSDADVPVKEGNELTFNVYEGETEPAADATPVATATYTIPANPLKIASAEATNIADKKITVKFNNDLLGRYTIEVKKDGTVVASATTECDREHDDAGKIAQETGIVLTASEALTAGTYTVTLKPTITGAQAIDTKTFELSDDIVSIATSNADITVTADNDNHQIKLAGQLIDPATSIEVPVSITVEFQEEPITATLTVAYDSEAAEGTPKFTCDTKVTILGQEYTVDVSGLNAISPKTEIVAPATEAKTSDAVDEILTNGTDELKTAVNATVEAIKSTTAPEDTDTLKTLSDNAKAEAVKITEEQATAMKADAVAKVGDIKITNAEGQKVTPTKDNVVLVTQSNIVVTVDNYEIAKDDPQNVTLTLDVSNMVRTVAYFTADPGTFNATSNAADIKVKGDANVADGEATAVVVNDSKKVDNVNSTVKFTVNVPSTLVATNAQNVWVKHTKGTGHYHEAIASDGTDKTTLTITSNDGLSPFSLNTKTTVVATVDGKGYTTLQEAVNAVKDGGTITVVGNASAENIEISKSFTITKGANGVLPPKGNIKPASNYNDPTVTGDATTGWTITAGSYKGGGPSGPTGPSVTTYPINTPAATGGKVTVSSTAAAGATVTITTTPDEGKKVDTVIVTDASGKAVAVTKADTNKYTFVMPSSAVSVSVTFIDGSDEPTPPDEWENPYSDVTKNWAYEAIKFVTEKKLMQDTGKGKFEPNTKLTRGMFARILYNHAGSPAVTGTVNFKDFETGKWYSNAVVWASQKDVLKGLGDGRVGVNDPITREQLVVLLWRYVGSPKVSADITVNGNPSSWAVEAMRWAVANDVIKGDQNGNHNPKNTATRAEVAQILANYYNK